MHVHAIGVAVADDHDAARWRSVVVSGRRRRRDHRDDGRRRRLNVDLLDRSWGRLLILGYRFRSGNWRRGFLLISAGLTADEAGGIALPGLLIILRDAEVVHELEGETRLFLQSGTGAAAGQVDEVDGPEDGDHPGDGVADGMAFAEDATVTIDVIAGDVDDTSFNGDNGVRLNDHAIEAEFHPTLAVEVTGIFVV